jgi:hypothetical protein
MPLASGRCASVGCQPHGLFVAHGVLCRDLLSSWRCHSPSLFRRDADGISQRGRLSRRCDATAYRGSSSSSPALTRDAALPPVHPQWRARRYRRQLSSRLARRPRELARLPARVQIAALFGVYSCSLRALQRYRSSSPQWGHLSAVS